MLKWCGKERWGAGEDKDCSQRHVEAALGCAVTADGLAVQRVRAVVLALEQS